MGWGSSVAALCLAALACGCGDDDEFTGDAAVDDARGDRPGDAPRDVVMRDAEPLPDAPVTSCECADAPTWAHLFSGEGGQQGFEIALGPDGSIYFVGRNTGIADVFTSRFETFDGEGVIVARLRCSGEPEWIQQFLYPDGDAGIMGLAVDHRGDVILYGYAVGSIRFGGSEPLEPAIGSAREIVIVKLRGVDGGLAWAYRPGMGSVHDVALAPDGRVVAAGEWSGTVDFGGGEPVRAMAQNNAFVVHLEPNAGSVVGRHLFPGTEISAATAVARVGEDRYWVAGSGVLALEDGTELDGDAWLLDFERNTALTGQRALHPGGSIEGVWSMVARPGGGAILAGRVAGRATVGDVSLAAEGETDMYLLALDQNGESLFGHTFGAPTSRDFPGQLATSHDGEIALIGSFETELRIGDMHLAANGPDDAMVARWSAEGELLGAATIGGSASESGFGVAFDACKQLIVAGHTFSESIQLARSTLTGTGDGSVDMFFAKLAEP